MSPPEQEQTHSPTPWTFSSRQNFVLSFPGMDPTGSYRDDVGDYVLTHDGYKAYWHRFRPERNPNPHNHSGIRTVNCDTDSGILPLYYDTE